jgi:hypothetical protein
LRRHRDNLAESVVHDVARIEVGCQQEQFDFVGLQTTSHLVKTEH